MTAAGREPRAGSLCALPLSRLLPVTREAPGVLGCFGCTKSFPLPTGMSHHQESSMAPGAGRGGQQFPAFPGNLWMQQLHPCAVQFHPLIRAERKSSQKTPELCPFEILSTLRNAEETSAMSAGLHFSPPTGHSSSQTTERFQRNKLL